MKKLLLVIFFVFLVIPVSLAQGQLHQEDEFKVSLDLGKSYDYSQIKVTRVIDGDILLLENGERVCLIGVDAPEHRSSAKAKQDSKKEGKPLRMILLMGRKAKKFVEDLVLDQTVRLEFDEKQRDQYGRLLAYVYLEDLFLNAEIIRAGFAYAWDVPPNVKNAELFQKLYQEARENKQGLWGEEFFVKGGK
jgi:micrococcal nuclease